MKPQKADTLPWWIMQPDIEKSSDGMKPLETPVCRANLIEINYFPCRRSPCLLQIAQKRF